MLLINELVRSKIITDLVARAVEISFSNGEFSTIDEALMSNGVSDEIIRLKRSEMYGIPEYKKEIFIDPEAALLLPEEVVRKAKCLPLETVQKRDYLLVGILDPEIPNALDIIQDVLNNQGIRYRLLLITLSQYNNGLNIYLKSKEFKLRDQKENYFDINSILVNLNKTDDKEGIEFEKLDLSNVSGEINLNLKNDSVYNIVNNLLKYAINQSASDIHIEPQENSLKIRMRLDGILENVINLPLYLSQSLIARLKILSQIRLDEKRKPQDGRFSAILNKHKIDFRVSVLPNFYGEKVVIRILDSYRGVKSLNELGFSDRHISNIRKALQKPYGLILISGPTGSGKTTTLYSMLNELDRNTKNVISLEDPIEYNLDGVTQSQIYPEIGYTFASGLRSILRQDPDVIMVGEIRDSETAELAIQAALTGHLVFSTIHTNNSVGVISRLIDMGIDPYLIAPTLSLAIAQRLVRRISPSSENPVFMDPGKKSFVEEIFKDYPLEYKKNLNLDRPLYEAIPSISSRTGLKGRIPVVETLVITPNIQEAILARKSESEIWQLACREGEINLKQDAVLKCMEGKIPFVEIASL